jgi:Type I phosphodiesterase / nucleotide pyrophosphatase
MSACSGKANGSAKANSACSWVVRARVAVPQPSPSAGGGPAITKVIVIGMDGLDPRIVESLLAAGDLPNLASVRARGGLARIATTYPAQTPVAWSTFATGTNPGGHGVFDFLRRDPRTYLPDSGLNRYEQKRGVIRIPEKSCTLWRQQYRPGRMRRTIPNSGSLNRARRRPP